MKEIYAQLENEQDPSAKMLLLLQLGVGYLNNDLARCEDVAQQLLALGHQYNMPVAIMHYNIVMGRINYRAGELDASLRFFKKGEALALELQHEGGQAQCMESYGFIHNRQGSHDQALKMALQAFALYQKTNAHKGAIGLAYNNIANCYNYLEQLDEAEKYYRLAIETIEQSDRKQSVFLMHSNLGLILYKKGKFAEAIANYQYGLKGYLANNNALAQSQAYCHIAYSYIELQEYAQALIHFQKGLKVIKNKHLYTEHSFILAGLGKLYMEWGGYGEAMEYLNKSLAIRLEKGYWAEACESYHDLHKLYNLMQDCDNAHQALANGKKLSMEKELKEWQAKFRALEN
ncbi:hypothetical protein BH09BAC1_BH09BAC1_22720 [soil metagenome]